MAFLAVFLKPKRYLTKAKNLKFRDLFSTKTNVWTTLWIVLQINKLTRIILQTVINSSPYGNLNATNLLALKALNNNNHKNAKSLARESSVRSTYGDLR